MIYKLHSADANTLLSRPETGMGYQLVSSAEYLKTSVRKFIVYNSELAVDLDSNFIANKRMIINEGFKNILNRSNQLILETKTITVYNEHAVREFKALSASHKVYNKRHTGTTAAIDSPKEYANGSEIFVRISAFEDDKRVDFVNKKLKEGSFTTTERDYIECVATSDDPVDRYALPNDEKIKWAFYFKPKTVDILQRGIVQPAFDHEGGGIEAYFENGTSRDTFLQKKEYGK